MEKLNIIKEGTMPSIPKLKTVCNYQEDTNTRNFQVFQYNLYLWLTA
jgi:hypothetical protein